MIKNTFNHVFTHSLVFTKQLWWAKPMLSPGAGVIGRHVCYLHESYNLEEHLTRGADGTRSGTGNPKNGTELRLHSRNGWNQSSIPGIRISFYLLTLQLLPSDFAHFLVPRDNHSPLTEFSKMHPYLQPPLLILMRGSVVNSRPPLCKKSNENVIFEFSSPLRRKALKTSIQVRRKVFGDMGNPSVGCWEQSCATMT